LIPALDGWVLCVDEEGEGCTISVKLPDWVDKDKVKRIYIALYIAARTTMDYRVAAALHIYSARNKVAVHPNIAIKALTGSKIYSKISRSMEDEDYAWQAVLYRGILYAQSILDLERPVLVKVDPPRDKRERERLRTLLEGKRVTIKGKTYYVGGLLRRIGGEKIAPWIYLVPKKSIKEIEEKSRGKYKLTSFPP
jgi:hypothetical protein